MDQVMDFITIKKFIFFKEEYEEFGQQNKTLDCEKKRLEHKLELLNHLNIFL